MKITVAIMAGGKGERFWPMGRASHPKQFLALTDDGVTMLRHTVNRLLPIVGYDDIFIITNKNYMPLIREQIPEIPPENLLTEPMAKNTSPCIGFAAAVMAKKHGDAIMIVLPADHVIHNVPLFLDNLRKAAQVAEQGEKLVTLGITPTYPETGYGYINFNKTINNDGVYPVQGFVEKPDLKTAKEYLASGEYLWNSGMFIWKLSTILNVFQKLHPDIYPGLLKIQEAVGSSDYERVLTECFFSFPAVSIDYGVMEKAKNIYTVPGSFGWDDVGSWLALERINKSDEHGNILQGDIISLDTAGSIIKGNKRLIAAIGLSDVVIVDTDDALLVCDKHKAQDVKRVIEMLKGQGKTGAL